MTQITAAGSTRRSFAIFGKATLTIEPSRTAIVKASAMVTKAHVRSRFGRPSGTVMRGFLQAQAGRLYTPRSSAPHALQSTEINLNGSGREAGRRGAGVNLEPS